MSGTVAMINHQLSCKLHGARFDCHNFREYVVTHARSIQAKDA